MDEESRPIGVPWRPQVQLNSDPARHLRLAQVDLGIASSHPNFVPSGGQRCARILEAQAKGRPTAELCKEARHSITTSIQSERAWCCRESNCRLGYPFGTKKADRKLARFVRLPLISSESPAQKYGWMPADLPTFNLPQGPSHERDREVSSILATIRRLDFEARLTDCV